MPRALSDTQRSYVYIVGYVAGLIKIGYSVAPHRRLDEHRAFFRDKSLEILWYQELDRGIGTAVETKTHQLLRAHRHEHECFSVSLQAGIETVIQAEYELSQQPELLVARAWAEKPPISKEAHVVRLPMVVSEAFARELDEWRRDQPDFPNRSEAMRRMAEAAFAERRKTKGSDA